MKDFNNRIRFNTYDIYNNPLPFDWKLEQTEDDKSVHLRFKVKNTSDSAWFYTPQVGKKLPECNT